jgi:DNA-binding response OmpR family regulator
VVISGNRQRDVFDESASRLSRERQCRGVQAQRSGKSAAGSPSHAVGGKDIAMRTNSRRRDAPDRMETTLVRTDPRLPEPKSMRLPNTSTSPGQHRSPVQSAQIKTGLRNGMAELLNETDGLPILLLFFVHDVPAEMRSELVSRDADIRSLLSNTLEKMIDRMRGSPARLEDSSKRPLAIVEVMSSGDQVVRPPAPLKETVLRVGGLEIDLIDRTAKRDERQIDLRPREFRLLKYMMQRSDQLLTRESLLKEVWQYKFVPETNLVDVHMGRLRRKVDGVNDAPMIRSVRGAGFVLSTTPPLQEGSTQGASEALLR